MSSWLLNIVGIVFIGVILELVMPNGKITVFIKHIFSVLTLFVILNPIVNFVNNDFSLNTSSVVIDDNFIYNNNLQKVDAVEDIIESNIESLGIGTASVIVNGNIFEEVLTYNSVYVDISGLKFTNKKEIKEKIVKIVLDVISLNSEDIVFYG